MDGPRCMIIVGGYSMAVHRRHLESRDNRVCYDGVTTMRSSPVI